RSRLPALSAVPDLFSSTICVHVSRLAAWLTGVPARCGVARWTVAQQGAGQSHDFDAKQAPWSALIALVWLYNSPLLRPWQEALFRARRATTRRETLTECAGSPGPVSREPGFSRP